MSCWRCILTARTLWAFLALKVVRLPLYPRPLNNRPPYLCIRVHLACEYASGFENGACFENFLESLLFSHFLTRLCSFSPDWDMIVVVKDFVGPLAKIATHPDATLPGFEEATVLTEQLDITVYHERYFRQLIYDNIVKIMYVSAIPPDMVLVQHQPLDMKVSFLRLKSGIYTFIRVHERAAAACWRRNQVWASKKKFLHVLRALNVALQLVNSQKIENLTSANWLWPLCASTDFATYNDLLSWYKSHFDPLYDQFKVATNIYKTKFAQMAPAGNKLAFLDYLQSMCANNRDVLEMETSITAIRVTSTSETRSKDDLGDDCFLFERAAETPRNAELHLAYRALTRFNGFTWDILALGPHKFWDFAADRYVNDSYEKFVDTIDWSTAVVYKKPIGIGVLVFYDGGAWKVVFAHSGFYCSQLQNRLSLEKKDLSEIRFDFWDLWSEKKMAFPDEKFQNFTFEFTYHPDERQLQLDAIMNRESCVDVTMTKTSDVIANETLEMPFIDFVSSLCHWDSLERVVVSFPYQSSTNDEEYRQNMEKILELAKRGKGLDFFRHEGFLVIDGSNARVQVSLPGYSALMKLRSSYERKNRVSHILCIVKATIALKDGEHRFCSYYPDWASWYRYVAATFRRICKELDETLVALKKCGEDVSSFGAAIADRGLEPPRLMWKLKTFGTKDSSGSEGKEEGGALRFFTLEENLYHGQAPLLLNSWVDHNKPFDDVQQNLADPEL